MESILFPLIGSMFCSYLFYGYIGQYIFKKIEEGIEIAPSRFQFFTLDLFPFILLASSLSILSRKACEQIIKRQEGSEHMGKLLDEMSLWSVGLATVYVAVWWIVGISRLSKWQVRRTFPRFAFLFLFPLSITMGGGAFTSLMSLLNPGTRPEFNTLLYFGLLLPVGLLGGASYLLWQISRYALGFHQSPQESSNP